MNILHSPKSLAALSWLSLFALIWLLLFGVLASSAGAWCALIFFFVIAIASGLSGKAQGVEAYPAGEWALPGKHGITS